MIQTLCRFSDTCQRFGAPLALLAARLWLAKIFFYAGLSKIASWPATLALFAEEYKVPLLPADLAAMLATATELSVPVLLALGLATRLAVLPLAAMTLVIQFTYLDLSEHFAWLLLFALLASHGAGALSLDHLLRRSAVR